MKNILLPTDFSKNSWHAIEYAIDFFADQFCNFHILNTYTPSIINSRYLATLTYDAGIEDYGKTNSEDELANMVRILKEKYPNPKHDYHTFSSFSLLVEAIKEIILNHQIDMVVMGTKGNSGLDKIFMGSNTVRVIKSITECPVMAIPHRLVNPDFQIAFATDLQKGFVQSELLPMLELAKHSNASIRVLHIQTESELSEIQQFNLNLLLKYLDGTPYQIHIVPEKNSISYRIQRFLKEKDISLLSMIHYQHSFIEKLTREHVIKNIAFETTIPFLVLPEHSKTDIVENQ
ncbi:MAG: universal stress protein [Flavobacteriaceae bacterium]|nr:universal stress protein [Flavobacteriaceae bacterium]